MRPISATPQRSFMLSFRDDLGIGANFDVVAYYANTTTVQHATLPPGGNVTVTLGETPQAISVTGAIWSAGYAGFAQAVSYTDQVFGPYWIEHIEYPSGVVWGQFPKQ